ncbi:MAG: CPBP family glutamic-type intramembrane protease [Cyanobacteriota bacterium]|nr:CPBP family glutamic-type intramembrane protease [Cyanobacteriota bacterium]
MAPVFRGRGIRRGFAWLLSLALVLALLQAPQLQASRVGTPGDPLPISSDALARQSPWNRPETYPLSLRPAADRYSPSAEWLGRLILPSAGEAAATPGDWVWIELEQAPADQQALIGSRRRLRWADRPDLRRIVDAVTVDIRFGADARKLEAAHNVVPSRLNGRNRVGPLQSLAGARPVDDVTVALEGVSLEDGGLVISRPPVQITGRWQGLVQLLEAPAEVGAQADDDQVLVRHFNPASGRFDGPEERIRFPRLPPDRFGRQAFKLSGMVVSPLNQQGWQIQGAPAGDGVFTVQALQPRQITALAPQRQRNGTAAGLNHLRLANWSAAEGQPGSLHTTALVPDGAVPPEWHVGERGLLIHLFGGIGGSQAEPSPLWTTTGHFAFGEAEVVRDAISAEPRLAIRYHQIYANNPNGIVAGSQHWSAYAGNLQRGWLGSRPFSDVLVPMAPRVLDALALQAEILAARYRSGDGGGVAMVTPATSCVQDSSQALWIAIQQLRHGESLAEVSTADRQRLARLGLALDHWLTPFGQPRADWSHNAARSLDGGSGGFESSQKLTDVLLSWNSMLPRRAHDAMAADILRAGLPLWLVRTNQIPAAAPQLLPVAPTSLLGHLPVLGSLFNRVLASLLPPFQPGDLVSSLLVLAVYGALALGLGVASGFLSLPWQWPPLGQALPRVAGLLLLPALVEELLFRVLLIPHPIEGLPWLPQLAWIALSLGLFVLYHPVAGRLWYPQARALFDDPRFLLQATLLGAACSLAYGFTGSLWPPVLIHWLAVVIWLEPLQGRNRFGLAQASDSQQVLRHQALRRRAWLGGRLR